VDSIENLMESTKSIKRSYNKMSVQDLYRLDEEMGKKQANMVRCR
jgi:hypothetical protein